MMRAGFCNYLFLLNIFHMLEVDLHSHSTHSDGLLTPAVLAARAQANGVKTYALTDHDELSGLADARTAAEALGMRFITGVEISVSWADETLHIVGLNFDAQHAAIVEGLREVRKGRHTVRVVHPEIECEPFEVTVDRPGQKARLLLDLRERWDSDRNASRTVTSCARRWNTPRSSARTASTAPPTHPAASVSSPRMGPMSSTRLDSGRSTVQVQIGRAHV